MHRTTASPRPFGLVPVTPLGERSASGGGSSSSTSDSPSKRDRDAFSLFGRSSKYAHGGGGQHPSPTTILVGLSVVLNILVVGLLMFQSRGVVVEASPSSHQGAMFAMADPLPPISESTAALVAAHERELEGRTLEIASLKLQLSTSQAAELATTQELRALHKAHEELKLEHDRLTEAVANTPTPAHVIMAAAPVPVTDDCPCRQHSRLASNDLALLGDKFDLASHEFEWKCDSPISAPSKNVTYCLETPTSEQYFQLTFFDRPGAGAKVAHRKGRPVSPKCMQLPPSGYQFPQKHAPFPAEIGGSGVHWPNLRVQALEDLLVFNSGTPKNLYHFNASFYDREQEAIVSHAARYIPFDQKVRVMLDIGSGGGSLGLVLKRRYDVQTVSTVFADWPYCEYITERGNLCMYLDAMEAMPFAKFSYDVVHSSWVFHALLLSQLVHTFLEQNRILRPGGYIWLNGGWSRAQVETIEHLFLTRLGYHAIFDRKKPVHSPGKTKFDQVPFELEWEVIMVKPIRAQDATCRDPDAIHEMLLGMPLEKERDKKKVSKMTLPQKHHQEHAPVVATAHKKEELVSRR